MVNICTYGGRVGGCGILRRAGYYLTHQLLHFSRIVSLLLLLLLLLVILTTMIMMKMMIINVLHVHDAFFGFSSWTEDTVSPDRIYSSMTSYPGGKLEAAQQYSTSLAPLQVTWLLKSFLGLSVT